MNCTPGLMVFLLLTFAPSWVIEVTLLRRLPAGSHLFPMAVGALTLVPALSALFVRLCVERSDFRDAGLRWGRGARWYPERPGRLFPETLTRRHLRKEGTGEHTDGVFQHAVYPG